MSRRNRWADMAAFRKKKILFTDLDGTLLNDRKEIPPDVMNAVNGLLKAGHIFTFCTGRPLASAKKLAVRYSLCRPGCYIIAYNGGILYSPSENEVLYKKTVPLSFVRRLFALARDAGLYIQTYGTDDAVLTCGRCPELDFYSRHTGLMFQTAPDMADRLAEDPPKVLLIHLSDRALLERFRDENTYWTDGVMESFFSCEQYLEYCPPGVSKGTALKALCSMLGIPEEDCVAAGDERNDIPMLRAAGIGAAPANAHPDAKAAASYVSALDNNKGAVAELIQNYFI